jgi:hypothetical protein
LISGAGQKIEAFQSDIHSLTFPIMKKVLFLALAAVSFSFASCDSKTENTQEAQAEQVEDAGEAKADAMEAAGNEAGADSVEASTEAKADAMENAADATDAK